MPTPGKLFEADPHESLVAQLAAALPRIAWTPALRALLAEAVTAMAALGRDGTPPVAVRVLKERSLACGPRAVTMRRRTSRISASCSSRVKTRRGGWIGSG